MYQMHKNRIGVLLVTILLAVILFCLTLPVAVYAIADPDDIQVESAGVFRNLLTDDIVTYDQLYIFHYNLIYAVYPTDYTVKQSIIFKLIDDDGITLLGSQLAYAYSNSGYGQGIVAFYFDDASAPTWGDSYTLRIEGNPVVLPTMTPETYTLSSTDFYSTADHESNQQALNDYILGVAEYLENEWLISLVSAQDTDTCLSSNGEKYFRTSIVGLQSMCPQLFFLQSVDVNTDKRVWGTSLSDTYKERLAGVDGVPGTADDNWIMTALQRPFDEFNIPWTLGIGAIVVILCVILIWQSHKHFQTAMPGYVGSLIVVMCFGILTLGFTLIAIIAIALAIIGGWIWFMRRA